MPTLLLSSLLPTKSDTCNLRLVCKQRLSLHCSQPSSKTIRLKTALPRAIEVHPPISGSLAFSIIGSVDGDAVPGYKMIKSAAAHYLRDFVETISGDLGVTFVTCLYVDEEDGITKFSVNLKNAQPITKQPTHVSLTSLELAFNWKTSQDASDPFLRKDFDLYKDIYANAVQRLATVHLARRYPLVFGVWRQKLVDESVFFPYVARSLLAIAERSQNEPFKSKCKEYFDVIEDSHREYNSSASHAINNTVTEIAPEVDLGHFETLGEVTPEESLCIAMERIFLTGTRPPPLRISSESVDNAYNRINNKDRKYDDDDDDDDDHRLEYDDHLNQNHPVVDEDMLEQYFSELLETEEEAAALDDDMVVCDDFEGDIFEEDYDHDPLCWMDDGSSDHLDLFSGYMHSDDYSDDENYGLDFQKDIERHSTFSESDLVARRQEPPDSMDFDEDNSCGDEFWLEDLDLSLPSSSSTLDSSPPQTDVDFQDQFFFSSSSSSVSSPPQIDKDFQDQFFEESPPSPLDADDLDGKHIGLWEDDDDLEAQMCQNSPLFKPLCASEEYGDDAEVTSSEFRALEELWDEE